MHLNPRRGNIRPILVACPWAGTTTTKFPALTASQTASAPVFEKKGLQELHPTTEQESISTCSCVFNGGPYRFHEPGKEEFLRAQIRQVFHNQTNKEKTSNLLSLRRFFLPSLRTKHSFAPRRQRCRSGHASEPSLSYRRRPLATGSSSNLWKAAHRPSSYTVNRRTE